MRRARRRVSLRGPLTTFDLDLVIYPFVSLQHLQLNP